MCNILVIKIVIIFTNHSILFDLVYKHFKKFAIQKFFYNFLQQQFRMSQICDGYSSNSLMGNWFQQKFAPQQPSRGQAPHRDLRNIDSTIAFADKFGKLMPLERMKRLHPWKTDGVISNYGFNQNQTVMKTHLNKHNLDMFSNLQNQRQLVKHYKSSEKIYPSSNPNYLQLDTQPALKVFGTHNISELNVDRSVNNNHFKSNLRPNSIEQQHFYNETTYDKYYGRGDNNPRKNQIGTTYQQPKKNKIVGEKLRLQQDPKNNTIVQRSWYPGGDKGIYYGLKDKIVPTKINQIAKTNFRKIRSQITLNYMKPLTNK